MIMIILMFSVALSISLFSTPLVIYASTKLKFFDFPDISSRRENNSRERTHLIPTSRLGGCSMLLSFLASTILNENNSHYFYIYGLLFLFFLVGFIDDIKPLSSITRLLLQTLIACSLIYKGNLYLESINFLGRGFFLGKPIGMIISLFVIIGAVNSVNMIDGMDGLAAGVSLVGMAMLSFLHFYVTSQTEILTIFTVALSGSIIGFLKYNTYPARIFMGDGGSNWLGCMIGIILIITLGEFNLINKSAPIISTNPKIPLISGLLCLAIPICDTAGVIIHRVYRKKSPLKADNNHIHHILLRLGFEQNQIVMIIYFVSFLMCVFGIFPVVYPQYKLTWLSYLGFTLFFIGNLAIKWEKVTDMISYTISVKSEDTEVAQIKHKVLTEFWKSTNRYLVYSILCITPFFSGSAPRTLGTVSSYFIPILLFFLFIPPKKDDFLQSLILAIASCVILVSINTKPLMVYISGGLVEVQWIYNYIFITLGVSASLFVLVRFSRRYLIVTPTDFLLLSIPLVFLIVPEPWQSNYRLGIISARSLVLFLALRTFVISHKSVMRRIKLLILMSMIYLSASSLYGFRFVY